PGWTKTDRCVATSTVMAMPVTVMTGVTHVGFGAAPSAGAGGQSASTPAELTRSRLRRVLPDGIVPSEADRVIPGYETEPPGSTMRRGPDFGDHAGVI